MNFRCRAIDLDFLEQAPVRFVNQIELASSPEHVFNIFEDGEAWPQWYKGIRKVEWTSPKPYGVGTTRTVELSTVTGDEYFFLWEQNKRFTFYFTVMSLPIAKALAEDYCLEDLGNHRCHFTYTVALEPTIFTRLMGPLILKPLEKMFQQATKSLSLFVLHTRPETTSS